MKIYIAILATFIIASCGTAKETPTTAKESQKSDQSSGYKIGDYATDFSLQNIDGATVSLKDFKEAKGFIITFTCNHCPFSIANEDRLIALDKKFKPEGYPVIAINPNNPITYPSDNFENMQVRADEKGFTFPYLMDEGGKIYPKYGAIKTPHMYVLKKTDKGLRVEYIGAIDDNAKDASAVKQHFVDDAVMALLEGREPEVRETKAIGCSIKK